MSTLDMLLRPGLPNVRKQLPTAEYEIKRLSALCGEPVIFKLTALPYDTIEEIREMDDMSMQTVLAGVSDPNLRDKKLIERYGGATPLDALKAMLLPGEIVELQIAIEKLCGYRQIMIEEVVKNSKPEQTPSST